MKLRSLSLFLVFLLFCASSAFALESKVINQIPERYALLLITGADPDQPLDKDAILALAQQEFDKLDVEQFQFAVYDKNKKRGDGVRAVGEKWKDKEAGASPLLERDTKEKRLILENFIGYVTTPQDIYNAYVENEVAADEDFTNNNVNIQVTVPKVEKDPYGSPNIKIPLDKSGSKLFQIYIDKKDPFLRKLKRDSEIIVRVRARGFVMGRVVVDGLILSDGTSYLVGEKIFTPPKKEDKKESIKKK